MRKCKRINITLTSEAIAAADSLADTMQASGRSEVIEQLIWRQTHGGKRAAVEMSQRPEPGRARNATKG